MFKTLNSNADVVQKFINICWVHAVKSVPITL